MAETSIVRIRPGMAMTAVPSAAPSDVVGEPMIKPPMAVPSTSSATPVESKAQPLLSSKEASPPSLPTPGAAEEAEGPWTGPFRLFDLPSELRLRIYEYCLAPTGVLHLTSSKTKRCAINPVISPLLLATCRQINNEAYDLLLGENEITITINAHDTCWPTISSKRLPQSVLIRLEHLCVVLDCTDYFNASYSDVDLTPFSALTALQTLRIAMMYRRHNATQTLAPLHIATLRDFNVVAQILERIPALTHLYYGTEEGSPQHDVVKQVIELKGPRLGGNSYHNGQAEEASAENLEDAAMGVKDLVRGCKVDGTEDVHKQKYGVGRSAASRTVGLRAG